MIPEEWKEKYALSMKSDGCFRGDQLVVGEDLDLRRRLAATHHDHALAGHPRILRTRLALTKRYWWPTLKDFVTAYVKGCAICQATKPGTTRPKVPLFPITPGTALVPFSTIALDLIVDLPPSSGYDSILTITDHDVSKASIFLTCNQTIGSSGVASLYAQFVFPHFGVPTRVILDRDTRFTSQFTKELCRQLDVKQNISTAYHPQTDGQSERTNQWLEQYLRIYCNFQQDNWASWLPMAQYVHNSWPNSTTGFTPFELLMGFTPRLHMNEAMTSALPAIEQRKDHLIALRTNAQEAIRWAQ
jgi:hypothetical protein